MKECGRRAQESALASRKRGPVEGRYCTSSRIFFHIMRVISSPSSSTTGFFTVIFSPNMRKRTQGKAPNINEETIDRNDRIRHRSKLSFVRNNQRQGRLTERRHAASKTTRKDRHYEWGKVWSSSRQPPAKECG